MARGERGGIGAGKSRRSGRRWARPLAEVLEGRQLLATITVNSAGDADGADGSDTLSLRQAIEVANGTLAIASLTPAQQGLVVGALSTPDTIDFNIPGAGPFTIVPATVLPAITVPVVVDGYSQPGSSPSTGGPGQADNAVLRVEISGANLPNPNALMVSPPPDDWGLNLSGGDSTVQGLAFVNFFASYSVFVNFTTQVDHVGTGIVLQDKGGNTVRGDFLGLDTSGSVGATNLNDFGIDDTNSTGAGDTIGGTAASDRDVISGNITGVSTSGGALIEGNYIGTDPTGTRAVVNTTGVATTGVAIVGPSVTVGGTTAAAGNVISGNTTGVATGFNNSKDGSLVEGNLIGTDPTGTRAIPNAEGIDLGGIAPVTIGGTTPEARNLISGNVTGLGADSASGALVEGNLIGTDPTGTKALPNADGVKLSFSDHITIGGTAAGAGNVISGNTADGIALPFEPVLNGLAYAYDTHNAIEGNLIGTDSTGTAALPNGGDGVLIQGGSFNTIGGTAAGAANVIASNGKSGVGIVHEDVNGHGDQTQGNLISGNSIFGNGGLGIDLGDDGVTANVPAGSPNGANLLQPYPVLTSATPTANGSRVTATLDALPSMTYNVEFFANPAADPSGFGQGRTYLGSAVATTDAAGRSSITFSTASGLAGQSLSATATDPQGDTSEFARDLAAYSTTTSTTLALGTPTPTAGQPLTLTASVAPAVGTVAPAGQVTFAEDGQAIGLMSLDAAGMASLTIPAPAGSHTFIASFAGSTAFGPSDSGPVAADFTAATNPATATTLIGPTASSTFGQPVTFAAVVATSDGVVPTGMVAFASNGGLIGEAPVDASGVAVFITNALLPGADVVAAAYLGDASHAASLSNYVLDSITAATTTLIGPTTPSTLGRPVAFAAVVSTPPGVVPTGSVLFGSAGVVLGIVPVDANGVALLITKDLPPGADVVAATYISGTPGNSSLSNYVQAYVTPAAPTVVSARATSSDSVKVVFSAPLKPGPARDRTNYAILDPQGRALVIQSATYRPIDDSVTLWTRQKLSPVADLLIVNGVRAGRIVDVSGVALDGLGDGQPGSTYVGAIAPLQPVATSVHPSGPTAPALARKTGH